MSDTPYGRAWDDFCRQYIPHEAGYVYEKCQSAFSAAWHKGIRFAIEQMRDDDPSPANQTVRE